MSGERPHECHRDARKHSSRTGLGPVRLLGRPSNAATNRLPADQRADLFDDRAGHLRDAVQRDDLLDFPLDLLLGRKNQIQAQRVISP